MTRSTAITSPPPAATAQTILVLGMHRSGTSALSRVLNLMGVDLGHDLLPAAFDNNETGFWEHRLFQWINRRIFQALGRDWDSVLPLPQNWWQHPEIESLRAELRQIIQNDFNHFPLWAVKDPRMCFLLPLWEPLLREMNCQPRCVLIFRNPIEVARSLNRRDQMPAAQSHLMWLRALIEGEKGSRGLPRTIVLYENLLADWRSQISRIARDLDIHWPVSIESAAPAIDAFLKPTLRHHQINDGEFLHDDRIPPLLRRAYAAVLDAVQSSKPDDLTPAVDAIARELDEHNQPLFIEFIAEAQQSLSRDLEEDRDNAKKITAEIAALREDVHQKYAELESARRAAVIEHEALEATRAELTTAYRAAVTEHEALEATRAVLAAEQQLLERERATNAAHQQHIGQLHLHMQELDTQLRLTREKFAAESAQREEETIRRNTTHAAELAGYQEQRFLLLNVLQKIQSSRSWRWTAPLRSARTTRLTLQHLLPASKLQKLGPGRWHADGPAHFILPCLPIHGRFRIIMKLTASVPTTARLFWDTGRFFNPNDHADLGAFTHSLQTDRELDLPETVRCFRLDPVDQTCDFEILEFQIIPKHSFFRSTRR